MDLLVADGAECRVYQCKNLAIFSRSKLRQALKDLAKGWLALPGVPRPDLFVVCCPIDFDDNKTIWEEDVKAFYELHGVRVETWYRGILDAKLRRQPDIVADLFTDRVAEHFCDLADWNQDLFRPLRPGSGERGAIGRYLELRETNRLVVDDSVADRFSEMLDKESPVFVLGPSGSGKTITSLHLADGFDGGAWRVFFVSLRHDIAEDQLVTGIVRRAVRPTIFVLDDCHLDFDKVERVLDRLEERLSGRPARLVITAQAFPGKADQPRGEEVELLEQAAESDQVLTLEPSLGQYEAILERVDVTELKLSDLGEAINALSLSTGALSLHQNRRAGVMSHV